MKGVGRAANDPQDECILCQQGEQPRPDHAACEPCSEHYFTADLSDCQLCDYPRVVNAQRTTCSTCEPGTGPNANRSGCVACTGRDYGTGLGPCLPCPDDKVTKADNTGCEACAKYEVAVDGVCRCAQSFYNVSLGRIACSTTDCETEIAEGEGCQPCPPCIRCPAGPDGKSSIPLLNAGFGLPAAWHGQSLAGIASSGQIAGNAITLYSCPLVTMCAGDHFLIDASTINGSNVDEILPPKALVEGDYKSAAQQAVSLVMAAGMVPHTDVSVADGGSFVIMDDDRTVYDALAGQLRAYYLENTHKRVVVHDFALQKLSSMAPLDTTTAFSCRVGHDRSSPLCARCGDGYAGGSTAVCNDCQSNDVKLKIFLACLLAILLYAVVVLIPMKLFEKRQAAKRRNQAEAERKGFVRVGVAEDDRASAQVYIKIIVSHFQVLMQFHLVMGVNYPPQFDAILSTLKILKGDILSYLSIKCALPMNLYFEFVVAMALVPLFLFVLGVSHRLTAWRSSRRAPEHEGHSPEFSSGGLASRLSGPEDPYSAEYQEDGESDHRVRAANSTSMLSKMFVLIFCLYPFLVTRIFHMFSCRALDTGNGAEHWHRYDYSIDCDGAKFAMFRLLAMLMVLVYPVGVPAFAFWVFHKNADRLQDTSSTYQNFETLLDDAPQAPRSEVSSVPWWHGDRSTFHFMVRDCKIAILSRFACCPSR